MGTLYYTGQELLEDKKRGKFRGRLSYRDANNKRRYITRTLKATGKRAANAELAAWRQEKEKEHSESLAHNGGISLPIADMPIPDYVSQYIDAKEQTKAIEPSTISGYRDSLRYIAAAFSETRIKDLQPIDAERWIAELVKEDRSSSTIGKAFRLLKMVLNSAIATGVIDQNPLSLVKPPKRVNKKQGINALDERALAELLGKLNLLELSPVTVAAYIALNTGIRRGEVCGLQWRDIDADNRVIWIRRSIGLGKGGAYIKQPKTDRARDVVLPDTLLEVLEQWQEKQRQTFADNMASLDPNSFILGDALGYYHPDRLSKDWASLTKMLNTRGTEGRRLSFHDLRHTWATLALAHGMDVKTVSSNLGHANAAMTLNVYASADPDAKRRAAGIVESLMRYDPPTNR